MKWCNNRLTSLAGAIVLLAGMSQTAMAQDTVEITVTADNIIDVYLSTDAAVLGAHVLGPGTDWQSTDTSISNLNSGVTNYIQVIAENLGDNPAMFLGEFTLPADSPFLFANGTQSLLTETTNWQVNSIDAPAFQTPADLGPNDGTTTIWDAGYTSADPNLTSIDAAARFLWHADGQLTTPVYFQAEIVPVLDIEITSITDTPDPVLTGTMLSVSFVVTNNGPSDATGLTIAMSATGANDLTPVAPPAELVGGLWTIGSLASGASATLDLELDVGFGQTTGADVITWSASVATVDQTDTESDNDSLTEMTTVESASDMISTFATSVVFTDGYTGTVNVALACNAGSPLTQDFDISAASGVIFSVDGLPFTTPGTTCELMISDLDSDYSAVYGANGAGAAASCSYVVGTAGTGEATLSLTGENTCAIIASPAKFDFVVDFEWDDTASDLDGEQVVVNLFCENVVLPDGSVDTTTMASPDNPYTATATTDEEFEWLGVGAANDAVDDDGDPVNPTMCWVGQISVWNSAIDLEGCEQVMVAAGEDEATCTITASVFFEGIPTLSQYGMALMALLMLGLGFVGMRRFV